MSTLKTSTFSRQAHPPDSPACCTTHACAPTRTCARTRAWMHSCMHAPRMHTSKHIHRACTHAHTPADTCTCTHARAGACKGGGHDVPVARSGCSGEASTSITRTWLPGLGCQDLVARTQLPGLGCQNLVARTQLPGLGCQDLAARTWSILARRTVLHIQLSFRTDRCGPSLWRVSGVRLLDLFLQPCTHVKRICIACLTRS